MHIFQQTMIIVLAVLILITSLFVPAFAEERVNPTVEFKSYKTSLNESLQRILFETCQRYNLPFTTVLALIHHESRGQADVVSTAGAIGLMQLMPATVTWAMETLGREIDPLDPVDNIEAGCAFLAYLLDKYENMNMALGAYAYGTVVEQYEPCVYFKIYLEVLIMKSEIERTTDLSRDKGGIRETK